MADYDPESAEWYYLKGGRQFGPVPERSIRAWLESGFLEEADLLWRPSLEQWTAVQSLEEFGGVAVAGGAPPPDRSTGSTVDRVVGDPTPGGRGASEATTPEIGRSIDANAASETSPANPPPSAGYELFPGARRAGAQETTRYAGFWLRVGAFVVDDLIVNALVSPLLLMRIKPGEALDVWQPDPLVAVAFVGAYLLYGALCESSPWQATLGKRAWRIRVTTLAGNRASPAQALVRQVGKIVSALGFGLGFVMAAISPRRQALHDWLSGCLVVKE